MTASPVKVPNAGKTSWKAESQKHGMVSDWRPLPTNRTAG